MAIGYGVCIGPGGKYEKFAAPSIARYRDPGDPLYEIRDAPSWAEGFNRILEQAADDGCESLIILHDDVELLSDPRERLSVLEHDVGVVGAIGGPLAPTLAWWVNPKDTRRGHIRDYRKSHAYTPGTHDVDLTDDPILLLPRWTIENIRLPSGRYVGFEALGVILSLSVRSRCKRVLVTDFDLMHHNPGVGLNDIYAWRRNELRWQRHFFELNKREVLVNLAEDVALPSLRLRMKTRRAFLGWKLSNVDLTTADSTDPVECWYLDRWKERSRRLEGRLRPFVRLAAPDPG